MILSRLFRAGIIAGAVGAVIVGVSLVTVHVKSSDRIFASLDDVPVTQTALVLGARVYQDGRLSQILQDRIETAVELYEAGKVKKILVSGDNGQENYDEVNAMKDVLLTKGIPAEDIFLDHAGFDTYDSLYRADYIFDVESLTVVTQKFHLPRAVYVGQGLGIETYGLISDKRRYRDAERMQIRESLARVKAVMNVVFNSKSKYLGEKVPITGDSRASWD